MMTALKPRAAARPRSPRPPALRGAFTLIEILIVVAIIAILAAIAVPNFLEAQSRSKIARVKSDMRTLTVALESFAADNGHYPKFGLWEVLKPVEYLTEMPRDVFRLHSANSGARGKDVWIRYGKMPLHAPSRYALAGVGPDLDIDEYIGTGPGAFDPDNLALEFYPGYSPALFSEQGAQVNSAMIKYLNYDPTNGTISSGDLFRLSDFQFRR